MQETSTSCHIIYTINYFTFYWWGGVFGQFSLKFALPLAWVVNTSGCGFESHKQIIFIQTKLSTRRALYLVSILSPMIDLHAILRNYARCFMIHTCIYAHLICHVSFYSTISMKPSHFFHIVKHTILNLRCSYGSVCLYCRLCYACILYQMLFYLGLVLWQKQENKIHCRYMKKIIVGHFCVI